MARATRQRKTGWYHGWNIVGVCMLAGIATSALPTSGFSLFFGGTGGTDGDAAAIDRN